VRGCGQPKLQFALSGFDSVFKRSIFSTHLCLQSRVDLWYGSFSAARLPLDGHRTRVKEGKKEAAYLGYLRVGPSPFKMIYFIIYLCVCFSPSPSFPPSFLPPSLFLGLTWWYVLEYNLSGDIVQVVEHLPSLHKVLIRKHKLAVVAQLVILASRSRDRRIRDSRSSSATLWV